jgi:NADH-quinone oxidoreductase subunit H
MVVVSAVAVTLFWGGWLRPVSEPRYRYDQLMNIGWKFLIPLGMVILLVNAAVAMLR